MPVNKSKIEKPKKNSYHRVTHSHEPRSRFIKRIAFYSFFTALTIFLSVLIFYRSKGYTFTKDGEVEKRGIVLINSAPVSAKVYIDGKDTGKKTDYKLEVSEGSHTLKLEAEGYRTWQKDFNIKSEEVEWFYYPYLIPDNLNQTNLLENISPKVYSTLNSDSKILAVSKTGINQTESFIFELLDLKEDDPKNITKSIIVPTQIFTRQVDGKLGQIALGKWSPKGDSIFIEHTYDNKKELINLRVDSPAESTNLTNSIGADIAQYRYDDRSRLYLLKSSELSLYNPVSLQKEQVIDTGVLNFNNFQDDKYVYIKSNPTPENPANLIYIRDGQNSPKLITTLLQGSPTDLDFQYTSNRRDNYLSIANFSTKGLTIYKNPLESTEPVLNPVFLSTFEGMQSNQIKESVKGSSQPGTYIALHLSKSKIFIYDFEKETSFEYELNNFQINDISWIDSQRLQAKNVDGKIFYFDYDGNYLNEITTTNQQFSYFIKNKNKTIAINSASPGQENISQIKFKE